MSFKMQFEAETMAGLMRHIMEAAVEMGLVNEASGEKVVLRADEPKVVITETAKPKADKKPTPKKASNGKSAAPPKDEDPKEAALTLCSQLYAGSKAQKDAVRGIATAFGVTKLVDIPDDQGVEFLEKAEALREQFGK